MITSSYHCSSLCWLPRSATSYPSCSPVSLCNTTLLTERKGIGKRNSQDSVGVLGMIAEPTGTDGHRPIGRPWHISPLKNSSLAEVICWSTRNTLPLLHPKKMRSPLPLTIRCWFLCLLTLKLKSILAGRSHPLNGVSCSSVSSRGNHSVTSPVGTRVSYEAVRRVLRAARRRYLGRVSTDQPQSPGEHAASA